MKCAYIEKGLRCKKMATMQVRYGGRARPLCSKHGKRKYHPTDLHATLTLLSPAVKDGADT